MFNKRKYTIEENSVLDAIGKGWRLRITKHNKKARLVLPGEPKRDILVRTKVAEKLLSSKLLGKLPPTTENQKIGCRELGLDCSVADFYCFIQ